MLERAGATAIQFVGTLLFNVSTTAALIAATNADDMSLFWANLGTFLAHCASRSRP